MTRLVLSLGSNIERKKHIRFALIELRKIVCVFDVSPVYESRAVGFDGPDFYNLVVVADTSLELEVLLSKLRAIEESAGRARGKKCHQNRTLDIDILLYGNRDLRSEGYDIPRDEIALVAYMLKPLADVLPGMCHPVSGRRFKSLWNAFNDDAQFIRQIDFDFNDEYSD